MVRAVRLSAKSRPRGRRRREHSRTGFYWVLSSLAAIGLGWIMWQLEWSPAPARPSWGTSVAWSNDAPMLPSATSDLPPLLVVTTPPPVLVTSLPPVLPDPPPPVTLSTRPVQDALEAQLFMGRQGISSGSLDGVLGAQTRAALRAFQQRERLPPSGELEAVTRYRMQMDFSPVTNYIVTAEDLASLQPLSRTWLGKSQQSRLNYETLLELVAERFWSHPNLIRRMNPTFDWANALPGDSVMVPNVRPPPFDRLAKFVRIRLSARTLQAFDERTNLLVHFPCSIAARVDKRPLGELRVVVRIENPDYTFNPEIFPESEEGRSLGRKLLLPPGPNSPVGVAWLGLSRAGYGIHGTPRPEDVGRTESHGCFRLANWNVQLLYRLVQVGTPVFVEP